MDMFTIKCMYFVAQIMNESISIYTASHVRNPTGREGYAWAWKLLSTYVAVPGRNQTFHCVFQPCYRIRSTVVLDFCYGWSSYAQSRYMNTWYVYVARMSPALNGSLSLLCFKRSNTVELYNRIMLNFYPRLPYTYVEPKSTSKMYHSSVDIVNDTHTHS